MGNFIVRTSVLEQVYNGLLDIQKKSSALGEVDLPCSLDEFMRRLHDANIKAFNEAHHSTPAVAGRFTLDPTGIALKPAAVLRRCQALHRARHPARRLPHCLFQGRAS